MKKYTVFTICFLIIALTGCAGKEVVKETEEESAMERGVQDDLDDMHCFVMERRSRLYN